MTKYNPVTEEVIDALKAVVGEQYVKVDEETLSRYKTCLLYTSPSPRD